MARHMRYAVAFGLVFGLLGCDYVPFGFSSIQEITANPAQFEGREIKIAGTVVDVLKIPILEIRVYVLKDDTGQIAVATNGVLPGMNQKIAIRGVVESAAIIGGQSLGLHVTEVKRLPVF